MSALIPSEIAPVNQAMSWNPASIGMPRATSLAISAGGMRRL